MNKNSLKNLLLILLIGVTAFSMIRYMAELRQEYLLREDLNQAQTQIASLIQQKQNLLQDIEKEKEINAGLTSKNSLFKDNLRASNQRITRLFQDKAQIQSRIEEQGQRLAILKAENKALIDGRKRILAENEQYRLKFGSVLELRKAIRELKKRRIDPLIASQGNRGYLIKDGQPTVLEKVKIEVIPAQAKE